ncbi:MAG: hypothetical protein M1820_005863 [Bogoriella megaspora]|nr:MAG: hypothetical protein M1820_005863 [Bogoriella megaspora]
MVMDTIECKSIRGNSDHSEFEFLSLPAELRIEVYRYSLIAKIQPIGLTEPKKETRFYDRSNTVDRIRENVRPKGPQLPVALLATCSTIHDEAIVILYGENTFAVYPTEPFASPGKHEEPLLYRNWVLEKHIENWKYLDPRAQPYNRSLVPHVFFWSPILRNNSIRHEYGRRRRRDEIFHPRRSLVRKIEVVIPIWTRDSLLLERAFRTDYLNGVRQLTYVFESRHEWYADGDPPQDFERHWRKSITNALGLNIKAGTVQWHLRGTASTGPSDLDSWNKNVFAPKLREMLKEMLPNGYQEGESEYWRHRLAMHPEVLEESDSSLEQEEYCLDLLFEPGWIPSASRENLGKINILRDVKQDGYLEDSLAIRKGWLSMIKPDPNLERILELSLALRALVP